MPVRTGREAHRQKQLGAKTVVGETEGSRHHSDHRVALVVEHNSLADESRVSPEPPLPQGVAENHGPQAVRLVLAREKTSAERWLGSQHSKQIRRDRYALNPLGLSTARQVDRTPTSKTCHAVEEAGVLAPVAEVGAGDGSPDQRLVRPEFRDVNQTVRVAVGQRLQEHGVHGAEDRCVRADAEGQRQDGNRRKARSLDKHPQAVARVLNEGFYEVYAPSVAALFLHLIEAAEFEAGTPRGLLTREPRLDIFLDLVLDMSVQLLV